MGSVGGEGVTAVGEARTKSIRVFINYRRGDSSGYAGRLYDALTGRSDGWNVFMVEDGNDYGQVVSVLKTMEEWDENDRRPMIMIGNTIKGYWPACKNGKLESCSNYSFTMPPTQSRSVRAPRILAEVCAGRITKRAIAVDDCGCLVSRAVEFDGE